MPDWAGGVAKNRETASGREVQAAKGGGSVAAGRQSNKSKRPSPAPRADGSPGAIPKSKGGRKLAKDAHTALMQTKPWEEAGMSRASWYRRQKEQSK